MLGQFYQFTPPWQAVIKQSRKGRRENMRPDKNMKTIQFPKKCGVALAAMAVAGLITGCATTGFSVRERSGVTYPDYIVNLPATGTNVPARPLVLPLRLAVVQVGEAAPPASLLNQLAARTDLVGAVSGLPLPGDAVNNEYNSGRPRGADGSYATRIAAVCRLAKATGADYVFIVGGNVDSWQQNNSLSLLDATIIAGALLPGTQIHVEGRAAGALVEADSGRPVFFVNAETKDAAGSPDMLANGKLAAMTAAARAELADKLGAALVARLAAH